MFGISWSEFAMWLVAVVVLSVIIAALWAMIDTSLKEKRKHELETLKYKTGHGR